MKKRIVVLSAGFGGLELCTVLSETFGDGIEVTLIDKSDSFYFGFSKLDVMFGHAMPNAVRLPYKKLVKPGVRLLQETVSLVDPIAKRDRRDAKTRARRALDPIGIPCLNRTSLCGFASRRLSCSANGIKKEAPSEPLFGKEAVQLRRDHATLEKSDPPVVPRSLRGVRQSGHRRAVKRRGETNALHAGVDKFRHAERSS